jgi:hypothetical protein
MAYKYLKLKVQERWKKEGSESKAKWEGHEIKNKRVPRDIPDHLIDQWIDILVELKDKGYEIEKLSVRKIVRLYYLNKGM